MTDPLNALEGHVSVDYEVRGRAREIAVESLVAA